VVNILSLNFRVLLSVYNPDHPKTAGVECGYSFLGQAE
jgi:hypothetical protein